MAVQQRAGRAITVAVLILASLGIIFALVNFSKNDENNASLQVGQPAPDFNQTTLDGSQLKLSDLKGKVVLLNFWGSWCEPCRDEMPAIQKTYDEWKAQGLVVVGVNIGESRITAKGFADRFGVSFPVVLDPERELTLNTYKVGPIPSTFFIDKTGKISSVYTGPMSENYIRNKVETLLAQ